MPVGDREDLASEATSPGCAWAIGFGLGAIATVGLLELGFLGLGFVALAAGLIAWKGPRLMGLSGLLVGLGAVLLLLFGRVLVSCASENASAPGSCDAGDIGFWVAVAAGMAALGVAATAVAIRRPARRR